MAIKASAPTPVHHGAPVIRGISINFHILMHFLQTVAALLLAGATTAFDCSAKQLEAYDFKSIEGVYTAQTTHDTPPSKTQLTWSIGVCKNVDSIDQCPKNSDVCGLTRIEADGQTLLAEIVGFNSNLQKTYIPFENDGANSESGVTIEYKGANWGTNLVDAKIRFVCDASGDNKLTILQWDGKVFMGEFRSSAACAKGKGKKPDSPKSADGESWGWFTWIFIFMVLFLSIYIIGGAWFQYNRGNLIDFASALREVLENFVDLLRGLPAFIREIVEKISGNSSRGEYSAV